MLQNDLDFESSETKAMDLINSSDGKSVDDAVKNSNLSEDEKSLAELYSEDRNIVDTLNLKDLKKLCKDLDVKFTNEAEIREHLKTMEALEDK